MAEPNKETVQISMPPRPEQAGSAREVAKPDTARIVPPTRIPMTPVRRLPPKITPHIADATAEIASMTPTGASPILQPMTKPPGPQEGASSPIAAPVDRGAKNETARINILPRPAPAAPPAINITKTVPIETIPGPLCWALAGISAVIFLIQIWNYVVS
jgi:hypothetical protein